MSDTASIGGSISPHPSSQSKKDWLKKWIQKLSQTLQTDENKKMIHVFVMDPILNYILERIFPYILIMCVLFVILTIMITVTLLLVFTRLPAALAALGPSQSLS
jgi:hypothetical protein